VDVSHIRQLALILCFSAPLLAHELGVVQVEATFRKDGTYGVDFLIDREHLPANVSPDAFRRTLEHASRVAFDGKPAPLSGRIPPNVSRFTFANDAIPGFFVLRLRTEGSAQPATQWVESGKISEPFPLDRAVVPKSRREIVRLYFVLGFTHILPKGLDHVLFVLGIFLLAVQIRSVLWQVTAFTVAHTITLALTIYGVVSLPPAIVEPLIALSIVYVAVENVFTSKLHAWRPAIVFGFGLLHGMGFAGVLSEIGLPRAEFVPALLSFNAGVECGQLAVILAAFVVLGLPLRRKAWYRRRVVIPGSLLIAAVGLYWAVERIMA
jgi:hydrogenase/urease accessory protein HupE